MGAQAGYVHGSDDPREAERLERQSAFFSPLFHPLLPAGPGDRVLDLATAVGAMAARLHQRSPGAWIAGLDLRMSQLRYARRNHPTAAAWVQADAARMPFRDGSFDRMYSSWFLEHVPRPVDILREVHRVLAPSGRCLFAEVDNRTLRTRPESADVTEVMARLNEAQLRGGGDPYVGVKLEDHFRQAGFGEVEVRPFDVDGTGRDLALFRGAVAEFAEILESLDESLGPGMVPTIRRAAEHLRALPDTPGGEFFFRGYVALGTKA
ncbi:MAG TPA: methyltransferase domain-containing protein [Myxococcales bacterium]|nr:methyltransferase domain-containing protein [Myxococcales bacterium]